jgi:hypothetical protein
MSALSQQRELDKEVAQRPLLEKLGVMQVIDTGEDGYYIVNISWCHWLAYDGPDNPYQLLETELAEFLPSGHYYGCV